jgi:hypothetical protein
VNFDHRTRLEAYKPGQQSESNQGSKRERSFNLRGRPAAGIGGVDRNKLLLPSLPHDRTQIPPGRIPRGRRQALLPLPLHPASKQGSLKPVCLWCQRNEIDEQCQHTKAEGDSN